MCSPGFTGDGKICTPCKYLCIDGCSLIPCNITVSSLFVHIFLIFLKQSPFQVVIKPVAFVLNPNIRNIAPLSSSRNETVGYINIPGS